MADRQGYTSPSAFRRALTDRLMNAATYSRWTLQQLQRQMAYDRFLERLYLVDQGWIVKGATALLAREIGVRGTIDIDVYRDAAAEVAERELRQAAGEPIGDWFRFDVGPPQAVRDAASGVSLPVTAFIGATQWASFHVDLVGSDITMTGEPEPVPPLARVAMPNVEQHGYRAYPLVDHIADKLAATFDRYGDSQTPSTRIERNIYRRPTGVLEVGFKDASGVQRWRTVDGGVMAARKLRDDLLARRGRGDTVAPASRLPFTEAATLWLEGPVQDLRPATQVGYRSAVEQHLCRRYRNRRLDAITADDLAALVRELRQLGKSEATIAAVLGAVGRIYKFAARRLGFTGTNPITLMLSSERPKVSRATLRPIFTPEQIEQTLAASTGPYRTLFTVAARVSELCGLTWADVRLDDLDDADVTFAWQVDRRGNRQPTKTDGSARTVPIPRELALVLARHKRTSLMTTPDTFVFATCTGRALSQRNVARALRKAQERATDEHGRPAFPALRERDVPANTVPSMHSFRHTVASRALLAGESVDEVAFLLGHRDAPSRASSTSTRSRTLAVGTCAGPGWRRSSPVLSGSPCKPRATGTASLEAPLGPRW
jgi:integrase